MPRFRHLLTLIVLGTVLTGVGVGVTHAAFSTTTSNPGDVITARPDWLPPTISATAVAKNSGYSSGYVKQGGSYYVYANVTDPTSNPAAGVASVTADSSSLTTGATALALSSSGGPWTYGGVSYNYRSALQTANATLTAGATTYSVTAADAATPTANTTTSSGLAVTVDNTKPSVSSYTATNKTGGTAGKPEAGDTLTLAYNEPIDPASISSAFTGASMNVTVRITDGGPGNDILTVYDTTNTTQLPIGSISLGTKNFVTATSYFGPSTAATKSTMVQSGNNLTITLGTQTAGTASTSAGANGTWTPVATPYDRAGNVLNTTTYTQTGTGVDF